MFLVTQCKSCDSSLIRFKLFNKFEIDKTFLFGLTCGISVSASAYLFYKLWKFNKNLSNSIDNINKLSQKFEYIILDLTHIDESRIGNTEKLLTKRDINNNNNNAATRTIRKASSKLSLLSTDEATPTRLKAKSISVASNASLSDYFETPLTSPQGSSNEDDSEYDSDDQFKDPIEDDLISVKSFKPLKSVLKNRKLDDNILVLLQQSNEYLSELVEKNENEYKNDEENVDKLIEYLKSLFALAERTDGNYNFIKETHFKCRELSKKSVELNSKIYITHKWYENFSFVTKKF
jgi:hypothetical protein